MDVSGADKVILHADQAAHNSWVDTCLAQGIPRSDYKAFCRGFNEGAAHALSEYLKVAPVVPAVPTVASVRAKFCELDREDQARWYRMAALKKLFGSPW